jgi:TonB family protein
MREAVSDVLDLRMQEADGLSRMVFVSLTAHAVILAAFLLMPASWRMGTVQKKETPMMISLGGAVGPNAGGMTQMSNRSVQAVAPPDAKPRIQPQPAAKVPEMTVPDLTKVPPKPALKPVDKPADKSASRKVTTGPEVKTGDARAETGSKPIPFGGLSTGGGGTGGVQLDVGNFCCPDYIVTMNQRIRQNWRQSQGVVGANVVKFIIRRDGMLTNVEVDQSSRNDVLDLESRRAVLMTQQLPPLPAQFDRPTLTVYLRFEYIR